MYVISRGHLSNGQKFSVGGMNVYRSNQPRMTVRLPFIHTRKHTYIRTYINITSLASL